MTTLTSPQLAVNGGHTYLAWGAMHLAAAPAISGESSPSEGLYLLADDGVTLILDDGFAPLEP